MMTSLLLVIFRYIIQMATFVDTLHYFFHLLYQYLYLEKTNEDEVIIKDNLTTLKRQIQRRALLGDSETQDSFRRASLIWDFMGRPTCAHDVCRQYCRVDPTAGIRSGRNYSRM